MEDSNVDMIIWARGKYRNKHTGPTLLNVVTGEEEATPKKETQRRLMS